MNVATILPQNYLYLTAHDEYFMCLGHLIDAPGMEEYTEFFTQRALEGKFVMMDNGLIEGDPRPFEELYAKALKIHATELLLPDVFCDKDATLKAIAEAMAYVDTRPGPEKPHLMLIPQGRTIDEWVDCAMTLINTYRYTDFTIGVPKVLVKLGGRDGRADALARLIDRCPVARHKTYHLLGCWTTPLEVLMLDKLAYQGGSYYARDNTNVVPSHFVNIRGVDSAIPFVFARAGKRISSSDRPDAKPINFKESHVNPLLLWKNVHDWRKSCDCTRRFF